MTRFERLRRQDGFIRELLWTCLVIAVIAVIVLDGMSLFTAYRSARDDAQTAAEEAMTAFAQTSDVASAKLAARQYIEKSDLEFVSFTVGQALDGTPVFTVKAKADAPTYLFKYLGIVPGLKEWTERMTHPVGSGSAQ